MRYCINPQDKTPLWLALGFMPFGLFFDFFDGMVARARKKSSMMGQELDSLADLVCDRSDMIRIFEFVVLRSVDVRYPSVYRQQHALSQWASAHPSTSYC